MANTEADARRMAREGYGHEDIRKQLGLSEYDARFYVFGKAAAVRWRESREKAKAS